VDRDSGCARGEVIELADLGVVGAETVIVDVSWTDGEDARCCLDFGFTDCHARCAIAFADLAGPRRAVVGLAGLDSAGLEVVGVLVIPKASETMYYRHESSSEVCYKTQDRSK
jgi:hypothetical protein